MQTDNVRDFVGYGRHRPRVRWPNDARVCLAIAVNYEEGAEYSLLDGDRREMAGEVPSTVPPNQRDLHNEMQYEYGSRVGVWRLLRLLEEYGMPATFLVSGRAVERNEEVAKAIIAGGHEPCGHGYLWQETWSLTEAEEREDIAKCVAAIERTMGQRPLGWLSRSSSVRTRRLVVEEGGFLYDVAGYNDELPYYVLVKDKPWLVLPYSLELNDMRCWRGGIDVRGLEDAFVGAFERLYEEGKREPKVMSVGLHCRISGTPHRSRALETLLKLAKSHSGVWCATRIEMARWWLDNYPAQRA